MKKIILMILVIFCLLTLCSCRASVNFDFGSLYSYDDASSYTMGGASITEDIRALDISWITGTVTVEYHDGKDIVISETSGKTLSENDSLYYRIVGDTLQIQYAKSGVWTSIDFQKDLTISLPKGESAYECSFDTISADVNIREIYVSECEFENVSGRIDAKLLGDVTSVEAETISGNLNISVESLSSFDFESVSGSFTLMGGDIQNGSFDSVSGNISLSLPEGHGYTLEFESVSGDIDLYGEFVSKEGDLYTVGDGTRRYEIETVSGNAKISKS